MSEVIAEGFKHCFKCETVKSLDDFYKHPEMADGRLGKCKECAKVDVRTNRELRVEYYRDYDRRRGNRQGPNYMRAYNERHPEKYKARNAVNNALRDGRLKRPNECQSCGEETKLHGHHEDYSKPLEVWWLCVPCHKARHKELGWGYVWNVGT